MTILLAVLLAQIVRFEPPPIAATDIPSVPEIATAQGRAVVVALNAITCANSVIVRGEEYRCRADNKIIVGIPVDMRPGVYPVTTSVGATVTALTVSATSWPRVVRPSGAAGPVPPPARLIADREAKNSAFSAHVSPQWRTYALQTPLVSPISTNFQVTDPFGLQRIYGKKSVGTAHFGIDLASPEGSSWQQKPPQAQSMAPGVVTLATDLWLEGNTVVVYHGDGVYTAYCHLSTIIVKVGALVSAGQAVGVIGSTGHSSGAHLHLTLHVRGVSVDPLQARTTLNSALP